MRNIEKLANIGLGLSILIYGLWFLRNLCDIYNNTFAIIIAYSGLIISAITLGLSLWMMIKHYNGKGITLHRIILILPFIWFIRLFF